MALSLTMLLMAGGLEGLAAQWPLSPKEAATSGNNCYALQGKNVAAQQSNSSLRSDLQRQVREVIFIDGAVSDAQGLAAHVRPGVEAVLLDLREDGLATMRRHLENRHGLEAIRLISHAEPGALLLSSRHLGVKELEQQAGSFKAMASALKPGGSIMLYGCDLAAGRLGDAFIHDLARITGVNVAASTNKTGAAALGGDWVLEARTGDVTVASMFTEGFDYPALLPVPITGADPNFNTIFVRPGGTSNTWTIGSFNSLGNTSVGLPDGPIAVKQVVYYDFNTSVLTRGKFQYSTNGGGAWTDLPYGNPDSSTGLPVAGKMYRFVDSKPADTTTNDNFFTGWNYVSYGAASSGGQNVIVDNPPTDVFPIALDYWGTPVAGDLVVGLSKTDTGNSSGGVYGIDSQSVANLFSINGASLSLGSGVLPAVGQSSTVTVRYYDYYQTDSAGAPISGQGVSRTVTMTHRANPSGFGNDLQANTFTANAQANSQVAGLSDGSFVVVWRSVGQDGETTSFGGIYGQKYTSAGVASGSEFAISPAGNGINESAPSVSALSGGRFVVAYQQANADNDVIYCIVNADGSKSAAASVASTTTGAQSAPWVTTLSTGNFAITWIGTNGADTADIWVRQFDGTTGAAVASSELVVNTTQTGSQSFPGVAGLGNGNYAVSWRDPANTGDVYARVMGTTAAVSSQITVINTAAAQTNPRIAALTGGGFVVTYSESGRTEVGIADTTSQSNIYARRYDNAGALQGSEFLVNAGVTFNQTTPTISRLSGGGFIIGWASNTDPDGTSGIFARRFNATGTAVDAFEFQLNQRRTDAQTAPALAALASDSFATSWADATLDGTGNFGIGARVFTAAAGSPPTVTAISPTSGTTLGGASVTITGTGFTGTTGVTIGGTAATGVSVTNDTTITCATPAHAAGAASVLVTTPGGTNAANTLYTFANPDLTLNANHSPSTFIAGQIGTLTFVVTNSGTGATSGTITLNCTLPPGLTVSSIATAAPWDFTASTATTVTGTMSQSLGVGASAPTITVVVNIASNAPASQTVSATVIGGGETNLANDTDTDPITVIYPPTVTAINPTSGTAAGGTPVTITGTGFTGTTGVTIGGTAATGITVINGGTGITCTTPAGSVGTASVLVTTPGGTNAANTLYTYTAPVVVPTVIAPNKSFITATTVNLLGNVSSDGGASLSERGIVYALTSANADPIIGGSGVTKVVGGGTSTGAFSVAVSSLAANSAYTYKAYATNSAGAGYTAADTFSTIPAPGPAGPPTVAFTDVNNAIFTRPGGNSFTWTISVGSTGNPAIPGTFPVMDAAYYNVPAFSWNLTRGIIEYAATTAGPWTNLGVNSNPNYITVANRVFRFSDSLPADSTTTNNVGVGWHLTTQSGTVGSGAVVIPDSAPTDIATDRLVLLDSAALGDLIAIATPVDTGRAQGGRWTIDAQSVGNLFTLQYDNTTGNSAMLKKGTGTLPAVGQTATVTLRYNDWFQVDANGNPTVGQGFSKTLTFTVLAGSTNSLTNFAGDTLVNTYTTNLQMYPAMATLSNGNYVVVWQSQGQGKTDSTKSGVYGQIFTNTGSKVGGEFVISNASGTSDEVNPGVTALNAGRFAVTYSTKTGADYNIGVRIVEANGTVGSEIIGNTTTASDQTAPVIATLTDGSFVVAWITYANTEIRLQQFAAAAGAKVGAEVLITNAAGGTPGICALDNGSYATSFFGASNVMVKVGPSGSVIDTGIPVGSYNVPPRLTTLAGGFVMVTDTYDTPAQNYVNIKAVRYNNAGTIQGSVFTVNSNTTGGRLTPAVATLTGGGFIVVWSSDTDEGYYDGIMGRRFSATGVAVDAADFQVNQYRYLDQIYPVVTGLAGNVFASAWMEQPDLNYTNSEVKTRVLLAGAVPAITVPGTTLTLSTTTVGTPGTPAVSFNLSGANLTGFPGNLTVTAPTNTQVSINGSTGWAPSIQIPYSSGTLASTPVYVRLGGNGSPGTITGNVTVAGGGATTANVPVSGVLTYIPVFASASIATDNSTYAANATITVTINTIRDQYAQPYLPSSVGVKLFDAGLVMESSADLTPGQSSYSYTTSSSVPGAKTIQVSIDGILVFSGAITITNPAPSPLFTSIVDAPPGAPGTSFDSIRSGSVISSPGALAFRGYLTIGGSVDANNYMGIWKSPDATFGSTLLVARSGSTGPDSSAALFDILPVNPTINNNAQTSFQGMLRVGSGSPAITASTDTGVWSEIGGTGLHLILREGDAITGGATSTIDPTTWIATGDSSVAFSVKMAPTGSAIVRGNVSAGTLSLATIALQGNAAPAVGGGTSGTFGILSGNSSDPRLDAAGDLAFLGAVTSGSRIYYQSFSGSLVALAGTGQTAPGLPDAFVQFERPTLGSSTMMAFRGITTTVQAICKVNPTTGTLSVLTKTGDTTVPGTPAGSELWSMWSPFSNASGHLAYRVTLRDSSSIETRAILTDTSGSLAVIAKVGDIAPGTSGDTFVNFDHPVIGDGDQTAFTASTAGGIVGVWSQAPGGGALSLKVKVGDTFTINSVTETVAALSVPGSSTGDRLFETRVMDAAGHMVVQVTYASGKTGLLLTSP